MYEVLLILHLTGAAIWTGGHLFLSISILPSVLKNQDVERLLDFEASYETLGITALGVQIITGGLLAYNFLPTITQWVNFADPVGRIIMFKLILLFVTVLIALHARLRVVPDLSISAAKLPMMAAHILCVTLISLLLLITGVGFRTGGLF